MNVVVDSARVLGNHPCERIELQYSEQVFIRFVLTVLLKLFYDQQHTLHPVHQNDMALYEVARISRDVPANHPFLFGDFDKLDNMPPAYVWEPFHKTKGDIAFGTDQDAIWVKTSQASSSKFWVMARSIPWPENVIKTVRLRHANPRHSDVLIRKVASCFVVNVQVNESLRPDSVKLMLARSLVSFSGAKH